MLIRGPFMIFYYPAARSLGLSILRLFGVWEGEKMGGGAAPHRSDLNIPAHLVFFQPNSVVLALAGGIGGWLREWCSGIRLTLEAGTLGNNPTPTPASGLGSWRFL